MEMLIVLLVVLAALIPFVVLVLALVALSRIGLLQARFDEVERRLARLETGAGPDRATAPEPEPEAIPEPVPEPTSPKPVVPEQAPPEAVPIIPSIPETFVPALRERVPPPPAPPPVTQPEPVAAVPVEEASPEPELSVTLTQARSRAIGTRQLSTLEATVGGKWSLWVGLILVLFAASFGIAYGWNYIGQQGRVIVGIVMGVLFLLGGEWTKGRAEKWYGEGLTAGGVGLLYLSIWAASARYDLIGTLPAFVGMGVITAGAVALAVRNDALSLIVLASVGGYLTPVLLRGGGAGGSDATLFWLYVTVLNAGVVGTATMKQWREVGLLAFAASVLLLGAWLVDSYQGHMRTQTLLFLTVNFLLFLAIASTAPLRLRRMVETPEIGVIFGAGLCYFLAGMFILPSDPGLVRGLFAVGLSALYGILGVIALERNPDDDGLVWTGLGLSAAFLTVACPLIWGGHPLVAAWAAEAAILLAVGLHLGKRALASAGTIVLVAATIVLVSAEIDLKHAQEILLLNPRGGTFLTIIAAAAFMTWSCLRHADDFEGARETGDGLAVLGAGLIFWLTSAETLDLFQTQQWFAPQSGLAAWAIIIALFVLIARGLYSVSERQDLPSLGVLAVAVLVCAGPALFIVGTGTLREYWMPLLNPRLLSGAVVIYCIGTFRPGQRMPDGLGSLSVPSLLALMGLLTGVAALSQELYAVFAGQHYVSIPNWEASAWMLLSGLWGISAIVSVALGLRFAMPEMRYVGIVIGLFAVVAGFAVSISEGAADWTPLVNLRLLIFTLLVLAAAGASHLLSQSREDITPTEREMLNAAAFGVTAGLIALWELTLETYRIFQWHQFPSPGTWRSGAHLGISLVWTLYAAGWLAVGIARRNSLARWLALSLFGLALSKVFFWDLSFLSLPYRTVSFGVLGLILIAVAWLYGKHGDMLREWTVGDDSPDVSDPEEPADSAPEV